MLYALGHNRVACVAFLVAVSLSRADWDATDRATLADIEIRLSNLDILVDDQLSGNSRTYGISLADFLEKVNKRMFAPVDSQGVLQYEPAHVSIFSSSGRSPVIDPNKTFDNSSTAQIAVTNIAETSLLQQFMQTNSILLGKIYNMQKIGGSGALTPYSTYTYSSPDLGTSDVYDSAITKLNNDLVLFEAGQLDAWYIMERYGNWLNIVHGLLSTVDYSKLSNSEKSLYRKLVANFSLGMGRSSFERLYNFYSPWAAFNEGHYGTYLLTSNALSQSAYIINNGGLSANVFTNLFTSDGSAAIESNGNTYSCTNGVFGNFVKSFLPSSLTSPDSLSTGLYTYVDSGISETPSFNPGNISSGSRSVGVSSLSSTSINYDFDDSTGKYQYNLINPLKTATDSIQGDTANDSNFQTLADMVNDRISNIFDRPLDLIRQSSGRWSVKYLGGSLDSGTDNEEYIDSRSSDSADGVSFVCWVIEATMFLGFFSACVRRSMRINNLSNSDA